MHRRTALVAVCAVVAAVVAAAAMVIFEVPEGMPWSFRARDGDPGLTRAARRMQPIAVAVDAFLAARGRCPTWRNRDDIDGVLAFVPAEMRAAAMTGVGGPMFSTSPRTLEECRVVIRLSHDELLVRDSDGQAIRWSYDRGDGTDPVPLRLSP